METGATTQQSEDFAAARTEAGSDLGDRGDLRESGDVAAGAGTDNRASSEPYATAPVELLAGSQPMGAPHSTSDIERAAEGATVEEEVYF